ncbi:hypothetical protein [Streptomyces sp. LN325]|uniref:hypothetical protein n=1 Tax=Streptomyces sp. LN325 TaxID=3112976 RepID=UPI003723E066
MLAHQQSGEDKLVHRSPQRRPGHTEFGTQGTLGGNRVTRATLLDQLEDGVAHLLPLEQRTGGGRVDLHAGLSILVGAANWYGPDSNWSTGQWL